jgi:hypothetical protein
MSIIPLDKKGQSEWTAPVFIISLAVAVAAAVFEVRLRGCEAGDGNPVR